MSTYAPLPDAYPAAPSRPPPLRVACIGGGMSGIAAACKLLRAFEGQVRPGQAGGHEAPALIELTLFEMQDDLGGTWYIQKYPGLACDSPSQMYSFWFHPEAGFTSKFNSKRENLAYLHSVVEAHRLRDYVRFRTEITNATWSDKRRSWSLSGVGAGEAFTQEFDVLLCCAGGQRQPIKPAHLVKPFKGLVYHSSEMPSYVPVQGKRIAVLGTGSSSIQIVPALFDGEEQGGPDGTNRPDSVHLFQSSPGWILPLPRGQFAPALIWCFQNLPGLLWLYRLILHFYYDIFLFYLVRSVGPMHKHATRAIKEQIGPHAIVARDGKVVEPFDGGADEKVDYTDHQGLSSALTPEWNVGCRRIMVSSTFYPCLKRQNMRFYPSAVAHIGADGRSLVTAAGQTISDIDVLVLATGFRYQEWIRPLEVRNAQGEDLTSVWQQSDTRGRFFGLATSGFPNLFHFLGPGSRPGQGALTNIVEHQADECVRRLWDLVRARAEGGGMSRPAVISLLPGSEEIMAHKLRRGVLSTVFSESCGGWYKNPQSGFPSTLWPYPATYFNWGLWWLGKTAWVLE
ncbi:unnamed protein product [Parajaminaea phylloscopi]